MKVHAIRTGSVRIKRAQVEGRGHGLARRLEIFTHRNWTEWLPTYAWAIDHKEGVIVVDTGQGAHLLETGTSLHPYIRWEVAFRILGLASPGQPRSSPNLLFWHAPTRNRPFTQLQGFTYFDRARVKVVAYRRALMGAKRKAHHGRSPQRLPRESRELRAACRRSARPGARCGVSQAG